MRGLIRLPRYPVPVLKQTHQSSLHQSAEKPPAQAWQHRVNGNVPLLPRALYFSENVP